MRSLDSNILAQFSARQGLLARVLVWMVAKDRSTGDPEAIGFWSGDDHQDFSIGGDTRTYYGAGALIEMGPLQSETGLNVRSHSVTFSPIAPEVQQVIRGYDPRLAPAEMHIAYFDQLTHSLLAEPVRVFRGFVNTVNVVTPAIGGGATAEVEFVSSAHSLTRTLARKKSHASLDARAAGDTFRQYASVTGTVQCIWGGHKAVAPSNATTQEPTTTTEKSAPVGGSYPGP
ncbi:hypothetical protein [Pseudooceanicola sp.]|uniref:hypothetical protein n=1 Tax=Pseudooceanicola sp. TaxID=1914328 RepID=UPI003516921B